MLMAFLSSTSERALPGWYSSCRGCPSCPGPSCPPPSPAQRTGPAPHLLQVEDHALEDSVEALPAPLAPRCWRGGKQSGAPGTGPLPPSPQVLLQAWPRTLPAVRVCVHLSHQGPVLVDSSARLGSQVQERAGAAAAAPADPLDDLGVGVGQLRQRASQLLLVSAGERASEGAGHGATAPSIPTCVEVLGSPSI